MRRFVCASSRGCVKWVAVSWLACNMLPRCCMGERAILSGNGRDLGRTMQHGCCRRCCVACCMLCCIGAADLTGAIAQHVALDVARGKRGCERQPLGWRRKARNIERACDVARDVGCLGRCGKKVGHFGTLAGRRHEGTEARRHVGSERVCGCQRAWPGEARRG